VHRRRNIILNYDIIAALKNLTEGDIVPSASLPRAKRSMQRALWMK
jgi:hypothetical protein